MHWMDMSVYYHVSGSMLERYQRYSAKVPANIAELKTALLSIWNDLLQQFIDMAIIFYNSGSLYLSLTPKINTCNTKPA